jgi:hypothetical protein
LDLILLFSSPKLVDEVCRIWGAQVIQPFTLKEFQIFVNWLSEKFFQRPSLDGGRLHTPATRVQSFHNDLKIFRTIDAIKAIGHIIDLNETQVSEEWVDEASKATMPSFGKEMLIDLIRSKI